MGYNSAMIRAVRISLKEATASKLRRLNAFMREYRSAANFYAKAVWVNDGTGLDAKTQKLLEGYSLSYRQRGSALRSTLQTVIATKLAAKALGKRARCPVFRKAMRLSDGICSIEKSRGAEFDYVLKVSSLVKGDRIVIPFRSHARLNHWLARGGKIKDGAIIGPNCAWIYVELPDAPVKTEGAAVGLDTGFCKLISDSDGNFHGREIKVVCAKVRRAKPGSKGKRRAIRARKHYIDFICRRLPWQTTKTFVLEDLTGMKTGKGNRGKRNRKLLAPWSYRQVRTRLEQLAPENRVGLVFVNPKATSRTCPSCGLENAKNRVGEKFDCLRCHYTADADFVGAVNILAKTTRNCPEPTVPVATCAKMDNIVHAM